MAIVKSCKRARVSKPNLNFSPESVDAGSSSGDSDGSEPSGVDSGMQSDGRGSPGPWEAGAEAVQLGSESFTVPLELYDLKGLSFVLSVSTWNELLSEEERFTLAAYLPEMDQESFSKTLAELFSGNNFHFGSPVLDFFGKLKGGEFEPGLSAYCRFLKSSARRKHYYVIKRYHESMLSKLFQMKNAWENCSGYGVQEKIRVLNIMKSGKAVSAENGDNVRPEMCSDDEHPLKKRIKFASSHEDRGRPLIEGFEGSRNKKVGLASGDLGQNRYEWRAPQNWNARASLSKAEKKQQFLKRYDEFVDEDGYAEGPILPSKRKFSNVVTVASYEQNPRDSLNKRMYIEKDWMYSTKIQPPHQTQREPQFGWSDENQPIHYPLKFDGRTASSMKLKRGDNFDTFRRPGLDPTARSQKTSSTDKISDQSYSGRVSKVLKGDNITNEGKYNVAMSVKFSRGSKMSDQSGESESDSSDKDEDNTYTRPLGRQNRIIRSAYDTLKASKLSRNSGKPYALKPPEEELYVRNAKQKKSKMSMPTYLQNSVLAHSSAQLDLPFQKSNSMEEMQKGTDDPVFSLLKLKYMHDRSSNQKDEFEDAMNADFILQNGLMAANRFGSPAQPIDDLVEVDVLQKPHTPLVACSAAIKKKFGKADDICENEPYESPYHRQDTKKKKKTPVIPEKAIVNNAPDTRPQKKPFTLITPTIHTSFSFSIIHLLSAVRKVMVTSDIEDATNESNHISKHEGRQTNREAQNICKNEGSSTPEHAGYTCFPSLTIQEIANRVRTNPGDPCILETQEPLEDLIRGALKIFSSKTAPLGSKGWKPLVSYEKANKGWSWAGPISSSSSDNDAIEEETSPEAWGIPYKMLLNLVNAFAKWLKSSQDVLQQIGTLPSPPFSVSPDLDERERFRDLKTQKNPRTITPSSEEQRAYFRKEELLRYLMPDRAFFYTAADGKKSSVAPLRRGAGKPSSKSRDHYLLKPDRPAHITILCVVRDAAARLPGGIGTRADVCTLIRDSQYVVEDIPSSKVNRVVSGALDRLHYELDPCIHFDGDRKLWVYLHRDREEEDFEDDGTSSTKNSKRPRKGADMESVNDVGRHEIEDPSEGGSPGGIDLNSDVNPDISDHPSMLENS